MAVKKIKDWIQSKQKNIEEILQEELSIEKDLVGDENGNRYIITVYYKQMQVWFEYDPYIQNGGFIGEVAKLMIMASDILIDNPHLNCEPRKVAEEIIRYAIR